MNAIIDPVPAIYQLYGNNLETLQKYRLAASVRCYDSCNRIRRNYGYTENREYDRCLEKCQEMANTIIAYEGEPYDTTLYNYPGYWGSYGNFGDYYFQTCDKEKSLKLCVDDCEKLPNEWDVKTCKQNCAIDNVALRDVTLECNNNDPIHHKKDDNKSNFYLELVVLLLVIFATYFIFFRK